MMCSACQTAPRRPPASPVHRCLMRFKRLMRQPRFQRATQTADRGFYERIFTPLVTLWYMIFQHLHSDHTLEAAVLDLHAGGADRLCSHPQTPPSQKIRSTATTAFSKARARLPLAVFSAALSAQAQEIWKEVREGHWRGLRVVLLDGSQLTLRPHPGIVRRFEPSANQKGPAYWVLMRVVALFCLHTGVVVASAVGAASVSEQALACQLILQGLAGCLYVGDRNFGIFWVVHRVLDAHAHCLFRLTDTRARRLAQCGGRIRCAGDYPLHWIPSKFDRRRPECCRPALPGRLIVAQYARPGFRIRWIYLFTTLTDAQTYSAEHLFELYAMRWHIEVNLRYLKTQMNLAQLECKSADMAEKEWMAGLLAYNLVRALMLSAALSEGLQPSVLSFSAARRALLGWLLRQDAGPRHSTAWTSLLKRVARLRQPTRAKPRPPEPRAKRHKRDTFPPLRGSRAIARMNAERLAAKS